MDNATIQTASRSQRPESPGASVASHYAWSVAVGLVVLLATVQLVMPDQFGGLLTAVLVYVAGSVVTGSFLRSHYPHRRLGLCNVTTQIRGAIAAALIVPLVASSAMQGDTRHAWLILGLAALNLALDGVDGMLARRSGLVSKFGARFDMEVDSAFALVLSLLVFARGDASVAVLLLGFARYIFVAIAGVLPWLRAPLPERLRRKTVCVIQIATLILLLAPVVPAGLAEAIACGVSGLLIWSFAIDTIWLARQRP